MMISDCYKLDGRIPVRIDSNQFSGTTNLFRDEYGDIIVSTVFLSLDHGGPFDTVPILFETMIFGGKHDSRQWRYSTYEEAEKGHLDACYMAIYSMIMVENFESFSTNSDIESILLDLKSDIEIEIDNDDIEIEINVLKNPYYGKKETVSFLIWIEIDKSLMGNFHKLLTSRIDMILEGNIKIESVSVSMKNGSKISYRVISYEQFLLDFKLVQDYIGLDIKFSSNT